MVDVPGIKMVRTKLSGIIRIMFTVVAADPATLKVGGPRGQVGKVAEFQRS